MDQGEIQAHPTGLDDPRLAGWYHTVDLGNGLRSQGDYDLRSTVDLHGLPESLKGKTALDIGTWDGFWAFEMERRGADRVVAIDVERWGDFDWLPWIRESKGSQVETPSDENFWTAHGMRNSKVERKLCNVYDLSPESVGVFDVVFCGSLLLHLKDPLKALVNIRSVTRERAIIVTLLAEEIEQQVPGKPWVSVGHRAGESLLGEACIYWHFSTRGLQEMMEYAGFERTEPIEPVPMPPTENRSAVVIGYPG
jgi:tRNA (mo5U34)-methyltransferase